ncbi:unnamed protein product, partial [Ectocarpus fasciculatus]
AVLVPTRKESFPTPADVAASFFTADEIARAEKDIAPQGSDRTEWQALLSEIRDEARERQEAQAQLQRERDEEEEEEERWQERQLQRTLLARKARSRNVFEALGVLWRKTVNRSSNNEVDGERHGGAFGGRRPSGGCTESPPSIGALSRRLRRRRE